MRVAAVLVIASIAIAGIAPPAVGASANVSVTDVTVSPNTPLPGEDVTVTATIRNLEASTSGVTLNGVALQYTEGNTVKEFTRTRELGTLSPGSEIRVPLTVSFDTTGTKRFRVVVYGKDEQGSLVRVEYPVVVRVSTVHPTIAFETEQPVVGVESNATVTLSNGLDGSVRNVIVTLSGRDVAVDNDRRAIPTLSSGTERDLHFTVTPAAAGERELTATVRYSTAGGYDRTIEEQQAIQVEPLRDRVELVAHSTETDGSRSVNVELSNLGNAPLENVVITGRTPNASVGTSVVPRLEDGETANVTVPVTDITHRSTVTMTATYDVGDGTGEAETTVSVKPLPAETNPGRVTLTGVDTERDNNAIRISGSASNVGLTEANSVIVRVVPTAGVTPAPPNREYFVGTVPESDFVSFDVYATVGDNVSSIPLEVSYLSDGERHTDRVEVPYEPTVQPQQSQSGGGLLLPAVGGVVVVAVLGGIIYLGWRNYRGGA